MKPECVVDVDCAEQVLHADDRDRLPSVTESCAGLTVDIERVVAGGEDVGRVVAGAGVQGRREERRRGVHGERVAAAAGVDRQADKIYGIVRRGGASGHRDAA